MKLTIMLKKWFDDRKLQVPKQQPVKQETWQDYINKLGKKCRDYKH